jgi:hypothetical protein
MTAMGSETLQALLAAGILPSTAYPPSSRYAGIPTKSLVETEGGPPIAYLARRLVPPSASLATLGFHVVGRGDRLDLIASVALGDPHLWWQIVDASDAVDPADLTANVGAIVRIPLPPGTPGGLGG